MIERKLNTTFTHPVYGTLRVVEDDGNYGCEGCYFNERDHCNNHDRIATGNCAPDARKDGKGIIFVKVK